MINALMLLFLQRKKVKKAILKQDQSKSPGPDNVHNRVLKEL